MPDQQPNNSRRNATSSWSGYLHQGKVGLFVALKKINELRNNHSELDGWKLEYETAEDFDIKNGEEVDSRHQVKANKNSTTKGSYSSVLNQGNFNTNETDDDSRFLHVIREIPDWGASTQANPNNIKLYEYPNQNSYCLLSTENDQLKEFCIAEIQEVNDNGGAEIIFDHLLFKLDDEIRTEHATKARQDHAPSLSFLEICSIIEENNPLINYENARLRKEFSESWEKYKFDLEDRGEQLSDKEELLDRFIEEAYQSDEVFNNFLRVIQPQNIKLSINDDGMRDVFFESFLKINEDFSIQDIGYSKDGEKYTLTAINSGSRNAPNLAKDIIENDSIDRSKMFFEDHYLINREIDAKFPDVISMLRSYTEKRNAEGLFNWDQQLDDNDIFFNPSKTEFKSLETIRNENKLDNNL